MKLMGNFSVNGFVCVTGAHSTPDERVISTLHVGATVCFMLNCETLNIVNNHI